MQTDQSDVPGSADLDREVDPLAGEELFEIPADLQDESDTGPSPAAPGADPQKGPPAAQRPATQPRDDQGRYAEAPAQPEDRAAPAEGQPPVAEPAATGEAPAPTTEEPEPELEFSFTADRQVIPVKGSKLTKDWLMIPREFVPDVQRLLSNGVTYQGSFRQRLERSARAEQETRAEIQENVVRAEATLKFFADLLDREEREPGTVEAWLDDFRQNRVKLEADATLAVAKAHQERRPVGEVRVEGFDEPADPFVAEQEKEELNRTLALDLGNRIPAIMQKAGVRGLSPAEVSKIHQAMSDPDEVDRYFRVAEVDLPEYGVTKGQIIALDGAIEKTLKYQAGLILDARKGRQELNAAEEANRRKGLNGNPIPPAVPVGGAVPAGKPAVPQFKTKAEMDEWFAKEDPLS